MPELPEVETVVRSIICYGLINKTIVKLEILNKNVIKNVSDNFFLDKVLGTHITKIERIGKWILFHLNNDFLILCHLRMTGKIIFETNNFANFSPSLVFYFSDNKKFLFCDPRKFGIFRLENKNNFNLNNIGPDVLSNDFNYNYLLKKTVKSKRKIKTFLMDQKIVSGIGNIYSSEILFFCKINPNRLTNNISSEEIQSLIFFSKKIINDSINLGGTSIVDFLSPFLKKGNYQKELKVYFRKNKNCFICNNKIEFMKINDRGSYFCLNCQK